MFLLTAVFRYVNLTLLYDPFLVDLFGFFCLFHFCCSDLFTEEYH